MTTQTTSTGTSGTGPGSTGTSTGTGRAPALAETLDDLELLTSTDPQQAWARAVEAEDRAAVLGDEVLRLRAALVQADVLCREGRTAAAGRLLRQVSRRATECGDDHAAARGHRLLSSFFFAVGEPALALTHARAAVDVTPTGAAPRLRADHATALAVAEALAGSAEEARRRFAEVEALAEATGDVPLRVSALAGLLFVELGAEDATAAGRAADRLLALVAGTGAPLGASERANVARARLLAGDVPAALAVLGDVDDAGQRSAAAGGPAAEDAEGEAGRLVVLAEARRHAGDAAGASLALDRAETLCVEHGLEELHGQVRLERVELLAGNGHYREAYEEHRRFHEDHVARLESDAGARARALAEVGAQSGTETDLPLQRSASPAEEVRSAQDALTGVAGREVLSARLPELLAAAAQAPLSVALVDLDRFARLNAAAGTTVGDEVLRRVAVLLAATVAAPGFVVRMGGQEFLLVLPATDPERAAEVAEAARAAVAEHDWRPLTGALAVTVSIGTYAVQGPAASGGALLAGADRSLVEAKRQGRDRVVRG